MKFAKKLLTLCLQDSNKCLCGDCNGTGFTKKNKSKTYACKKCMRCKGVGFTIVGSVKR